MRQCVRRHIPVWTVGYTPRCGQAGAHLKSSSPSDRGEALGQHKSAEPDLLPLEGQKREKSYVFPFPPNFDVFLAQDCISLNQKIRSDHQ